MSDLIRKSDVIKLINCFAFSLYKEQDDKIKKVLKEYIEKMPTAYSVDDVVKELEELKEGYLNSFVIHNDDELYGVACGLGDAIEIVKQGFASDDCCEWKDNGLYGYSTSCTEFISKIAYKDTFFEYCPYCGKKIKAVE